MGTRIRVLVAVLAAWAGMACGQTGSTAGGGRGDHRTGEMVLSPYSYGAKCDATVANHQVGGTDDRVALRAWIADGLRLGVKLKVPDGVICRADKPGGVMTSFSVSGRVLHGRMSSHLAAGDELTFNGLTSAAGKDLDETPLTVISADGSGFTAAWNHADVAETKDLGYGDSPLFQIDTPGLDVEGSGNPANTPSGVPGGAPTSVIASYGIGSTFQFSHDKSAQVVSASRDAAGVITVRYLAMRAGLNFPKGESIQLKHTPGGALDGFYAAVATNDTTQHVLTIITNVKGKPTGDLVGGLLHEPWTNFDADGEQGYSIRMLGIVNYDADDVQGMIPCGIDQFHCAYRPGNNAITDWRGGGGIVEHNHFSGMDTGIKLVQADFMMINDNQFDNGRLGIYFGPKSSPNAYVLYYNDYAMQQSIVVDGAEGINVHFSHFRSGNETHDAIAVTNRDYDLSPDTYTAYAGNGGYPANGISLTENYLEANNPGQCSHAPHAFIGIDQELGSVATTQTVTVEKNTVVNPGKGSSCNVQAMVEVGDARKSPYGLKPNLALVRNSSTDTFQEWVHNLGSAAPSVLFDSVDPVSLKIPIVRNSGAGMAAVTSWEMRPMHAPASASEACEPGQWSDGESAGKVYHFVCTAKNTWQRVQLSPF